MQPSASEARPTSHMLKTAEYKGYGEARIAKLKARFVIKLVQSIYGGTCAVRMGMASRGAAEEDWEKVCSEDVATMGRCGRTLVKRCGTAEFGGAKRYGLIGTTDG